MKCKGWFILICLCTGVAAIAASQVGATSETFTVGQSGSLTVRLKTGDIQISPGTEGQIRVEAVGIDERNLSDLKMTQSGSNVTVAYEPRGRSRNVRFEIRVPQRCDVDVTTAGGNISVEGRIEGRIKGVTAGGEIRLGDVGGDLSMTTAGGNILAGGILGSAVLTTSGGNIRIEAVRGDVEATTAGGHITVASVGGRLRARTAGGDIKLGDVGGDADASTSGGDIRVGRIAESARLRTSGGDIFLDAASGKVDASTAGGDLVLRQVTGAINGSSAGGDIRAELNPTGPNESSLKTAGGDIELLVPPGARATVEARINLRGGSRGGGSDEHDIYSDFGTVDYTRTESGLSARIPINGGGPVVTLETTNGDIRVRQGGL